MMSVFILSLLRFVYCVCVCVYYLIFLVYFLYARLCF